VATFRNIRRDRKHPTAPFFGESYGKIISKICRRPSKLQTIQQAAYTKVAAISFNARCTTEFTYRVDAQKVSTYQIIKSYKNLPMKLHFLSK